MFIQTYMAHTHTYTQIPKTFTCKKKKTYTTIMDFSGRVSMLVLDT
jgi:hypothetical protein